MSKEKSDKSDRKEKKEKKREKVTDDGVKKSKKEKKERRESQDAAAVAIEASSPGVDADGDVIIDAQPAQTSDALAVIPKAALVPFANPLADDKSGRKVLKTVKKAAKAKCLKRGVKEVVKAVRKTPPGNPSTPATALPTGVVILAADISPMDVISHIPVLCEDHNIPYAFVPSRAELGAAGSTKRPTSVVMVVPSAGKKAGEEGEEWEETYRDLNKLVHKMGQYVKV